MNVLEKDKTHGKARSGQWPDVRAKFLKGKVCAVCGGKKHLEAHHLRPFHTHPDLELVPENLLPLCENKADGVNCHLLFGHLGNFKSINVNCVKDTASWSGKIASRP